MATDDHEFDARAYQVEILLRELRHLVADTVILSDAQTALLHSMAEALRPIENQAASLRVSLLTGADPLPMDQDRTDEGDDEGSSSVPAVPVSPTPVRTGGAARTFEEARESARNP